MSVKKHIACMSYERVTQCSMLGNPTIPITACAGISDTMRGLTKLPPVGLFLKCAPQSDSWLFEQYTLDECRDLTLGYCGTIPWFWGANWRWRRERYIVNKAEEALIQHYRPCFNVDMNPNPTLPPERYQKLIARIGLKRYRSK